MSAAGGRVPAREGSRDRGTPGARQTGGATQGYSDGNRGGHGSPSPLPPFEEVPDLWVWWEWLRGSGWVGESGAKPAPAVIPHGTQKKKKSPGLRFLGRCGISRPWPERAGVSAWCFRKKKKRSLSYNGTAALNCNGLLEMTYAEGRH